MRNVEFLVVCLNTETYKKSAFGYYYSVIVKKVLCLFKIGRRHLESLLRETKLKDTSLRFLVAKLLGNVNSLFAVIFLFPTKGLEQEAANFMYDNYHVVSVFIDAVSTADVYVTRHDLRCV
jgi:hypothetical protein